MATATIFSEFAPAIIELTPGDTPQTIAAIARAAVRDRDEPGRYFRLPDAARQLALDGIVQLHDWTMVPDEVLLEGAAHRWGTVDECSRRMRALAHRIADRLRYANPTISVPSYTEAFVTVSLENDLAVVRVSSHEVGKLYSLVAVSAGVVGNKLLSGKLAEIPQHFRWPKEA